MAIVKATYTKSSNIAKAGIRYIENRPGREGEKVKRELYGAAGGMDRQQASVNHGFRGRGCPRTHRAASERASVVRGRRLPSEHEYGAERAVKSGHREPEYRSRVRRFSRGRG